MTIRSAVFKLGSADQRGSATVSQGVRERIQTCRWKWHACMFIQH